jgi:hypothetical protein
MEEKSTGKYRSRPVILELLKEQLESGLSVRSFCARHSIAEGSFYGWKKRYGNEKAVVNGNAFSRMQVTTAPGALFAEVNGIKLYQPVSAAYLKELAL